MNVLELEDEVFRRLVTENGFRWLQIPNILANHYCHGFRVSQRNPDEKLEVREVDIAPFWSWHTGYVDGLTAYPSLTFKKLLVVVRDCFRLFRKGILETVRYFQGYNAGKRKASISARATTVLCQPHTHDKK